MKSFHRGLLLAASAPLILLLAGPALAVSEFTTYKCDYPQDASGDTYDYFRDNPLNTNNLEDNDCERLCRALKDICLKNVRNRVSCARADDRFWFTLQDKLCDANNEDPEDRRSCKNSVEAQRESDRESLDGARDDGKQNCEQNFGEESSCPSDCQDGTLNDD